MNLPFLGRAIDERFLTHRLRSTSIAGVSAGVLAMGLFAYRYYVNHLWSWDLLAIGLAFVLVKMSLMVWYAVRD